MREKHPLAGKTVVLKSVSEEFDGRSFKVKDWWQNVNPTGISWQHCSGDRICMEYGFRGGCIDLLLDDEVVYGKIGRYELLVHVSELGEEVSAT